MRSLPLLLSVVDTTLLCACFASWHASAETRPTDIALASSPERQITDKETVDYQYFNDLAYNADRGSVTVWDVRFHTEL